MVRCSVSLWLLCLSLALLGTPGHADGQQQTRERALLQQKVRLLESMLDGAASTRKIMSGDDEKAKSLILEARRHHRSAIALIDSDRLAEARAEADTALQLLTSASRSAREGERASRAHRSRYQELLDGIRSLDTTARQPFPDRIKEQVAEGRQLADRGNYRAAVEQLDEAYRAAAQHVARALDKKTVIYALEFASPDEEYRYEQGRYASSRELVSYLRAARHPVPERLIERYLDDAGERQAAAGSAADAGDYPAAIEQMEQANDLLQRLLRLLGAQL